MGRVVAGLVFLALSLPADGGVPAVNANQEVHAVHQRLLAARTEAERVAQMRSLLGALSKLNQDQVAALSDASVDEVAALLNTDGELGRYYGGRALAAIACRAHAALPALRKALSEAEPIRSDFEGIALVPPASPYAEVEKAIMKIEHAEACGHPGRPE